MAKKVCILETSFIIREGIKHIVSGLNDFMVSGVFEDVASLEASNVFHGCNLLVCNPDLIKNIQTLTRFKIKNPHIHVLVIDQERGAFRDFFTPASTEGYIFLCCHTDEVLKALLAVARGEKFFCDKALGYFLSGKNKAESCAPLNLSERETEVLKLITKGMSSKEISANLNLSFHTITTHRKNIARKLKVKKMGELISVAHNLKLV